MIPKASSEPYIEVEQSRLWQNEIKQNSIPKFKESTTRIPLKLSMNSVAQLIIQRFSMICTVFQ